MPPELLRYDDPELKRLPLSPRLVDDEFMFCRVPVEVPLLRTPKRPVSVLPLPRHDELPEVLRPEPAGRRPELL